MKLLCSSTCPKIDLMKNGFSTHIRVEGDIAQLFFAVWSNIFIRLWVLKNSPPWWPSFSTSGIPVKMAHAGKFDQIRSKFHPNSKEMVHGVLDCWWPHPACSISHSRLFSSMEYKPIAQTAKDELPTAIFISLRFTFLRLDKRP